MASKIYTKTGDGGTTSLLGGTKVPKSHLRVDAYGSVDELNSYIGLCRDLVTGDLTRMILLQVQELLFTIGSSLACDPEKEPKLQLPDLKESDTIILEKEIDRMNDALPPMTNFILPGGHPVVSHIHIARCICRRAERRCVALNNEHPVSPLIIPYLNRLSDFLFMLARYTGLQLDVAEIPWKPRG